MFEGPSEEDSESEFDLNDLGAEFDSIFKDFVEELKEPFNDLKQTVVGGMAELQQAFGDLGSELKGAVNSEDGRNLLRELGQQLQRMADGIDDEDSSESESSEDAPDLHVIIDEDSVEVIEPEEWVDQLVEDIKGHQAEDDSQARSASQEEKEENSIDIPSKTALGRMKKAALIELANALNLEVNTAATKAVIITIIDSAR